MDKPIRKRLRLEGYDYSRNGAYFITVCIQNRERVLGQVVGFGILDEPKVELSDEGTEVFESIQYFRDHSNDVTIDKYVIMPNHIHLILIVEHGSSGMPNPTNARVPKAISSLKRYTNKACGFAMWQPHYYDHIIRDEEDYLRICQYIDENPSKWKEDEYFK